MVVRERFIAVLVSHDAAVTQFVAEALDASDAGIELHVLTRLAALERYTQHARVQAVILHTTEAHKDPLQLLVAYQQAAQRAGTMPVPAVLIGRHFDPTLRQRALKTGAEDTVDLDPLGQRALSYLLMRAADSAGAFSRHRQELLRLQALGELASGVAHDFNNFLSAIVGRVEVLKRAITDSAQARSLDIIERAAFDASETVRRIRRFARGETPPPHTDVNLRALIDEAVSFIAPRLQTAHIIHVEGPERLNVDGNPTELKEVVINLLQNAIDAMPNGGHIYLDLIQQGDRVVLNVRDTGFGMPQAVVAHATEPFFSTKGDGGSGLGLSISADIMRRHRGSLEITSDEGSGTLVALRFPLR